MTTEEYFPHAVSPVIDIDRTFYYVSCPLWLLALICLAWPVTSYILARRKSKRGFPVSVAPLPLGEVPSESASEAERASDKPG